MLESAYFPSLETKVLVFKGEILKTLQVIVNRRQNLQTQEMLILYKKQLNDPLTDHELKIQFISILQKLDWNVSVFHTEKVYDFFGTEHECQKETVYHMDLYLLDLLFEVSGGKNREMHKKALNVFLDDLNIRTLLGKELRKCEFLFTDEESLLYKNILLLFIKLHTTVSLLTQEHIEDPDSAKVADYIKKSTLIVKECISMQKSTKNKVLFQNLLYHSGIYTLFIKILKLKYFKTIEPLFKVTILILRLFCKKNKRNQKILLGLIKNIIELLPLMNLTEFLSEILSSCRTHEKGLKVLSKVLSLIDSQGCSIDYICFLRGYLKDSQNNVIESMQMDIMKSIFNSKGIKNVAENETYDIFLPNCYIESLVLNNKQFAVHIELIKTIIACSIKNSFGILQGRKLIPINILKQCILKPGVPYLPKQVYFRYIQLIYLSRIEGELEPDININVLDDILKTVYLQDLLKFKNYLNPIIDLAKDGKFKTILKNSRIIQKPKQGEQEIIDYWNYLSQKST